MKPFLISIITDVIDAPVALVYNLTLTLLKLKKVILIDFQLLN